MGFNRDVIRRRRDEMNDLGVRVRWAGRRPRLWRWVIKELEIAEELTSDNDVLHADDVRELRRPSGDRRCGGGHGPRRRAGRLDPDKINERTVSRAICTNPDMPDVDLFVRSSGEQRTRNFLLWQSAYAEMVFLDSSGRTSTAWTCGRRAPRTPPANAASARPETAASVLV